MSAKSCGHISLAWWVQPSVFIRLCFLIADYDWLSSCRRVGNLYFLNPVFRVCVFVGLCETGLAAQPGLALNLNLCYLLTTRVHWHTTTRAFWNKPVKTREDAGAEPSSNDIPATTWNRYWRFPRAWKSPSSASCIKSLRCTHTHNQSRGCLIGTTKQKPMVSLSCLTFATQQ